MRMSWNELVGFIDAADPSFMAKTHGVPRSDVEATEAGCRITLPDLYRQFLMTMGVDSDGFPPFGATQMHGFYDVIAELPTEDYPRDRYFRVSLASDDSQISPPDWFLDLARGDANDAPLVTFEGGGGFAPQNVVDTGFTFGEHITDAVFRFFELDRRPATDRIFVANLSPPEARRRMKVAADLLTKMGFEVVLPVLARVTCLRRKTASVVIAVREPTELLKLNVGCADRKELGTLIDQILVGLPGAEIFPKGA
jgi:hypothetical protein